MKCTECNKRVLKSDPHGLPWIHAECARKLPVGGQHKALDTERIITEHGATELSKTPEGRAVLARERKKWAKECLQPTDPEFQKEYGPMLKQREEMRRENERISQQMKRDRGLV